MFSFDHEFYLFVCLFFTFSIDVKLLHCFYLPLFDG